MHVVHSSAWCRPYDTGGTEVYLEGLVAELEARGVRNSVLAPRHAAAPPTYLHEGVVVETYPVNATPASDEIRAQARHSGFGEFLDALGKHQGAIYHQHSWTRGCGPHHLRAARDLGFPTVLTVHVAGNLCLRGTMLRFGETPCEGAIGAVKCGECWLNGRGAPKPLARAIARAPASLASRALATQGRLATAFSARALAERARRDFAEMTRNADRIVAVCQWLYDALVDNGVPPSKLALSRQGVSRNVIPQAGQARNGPLRLLMLARFDPGKGLETAVAAVRALPVDLAVILEIYAIPASGEGESYERRVRAEAASDSRIRIAPPVARDRLPEVLSRADVLLVPSIWLETGPLTVLEAQAAGLFVLGSRRGGVAELVGESPAGELVEAQDVKAWSEAIRRLAGRKAAGDLPRYAGRVRTMADAADDMIDIYRTLSRESGREAMPALSSGS